MADAASSILFHIVGLTYTILTSDVATKQIDSFHADMNAYNCLVFEAGHMLTRESKHIKRFDYGIFVAEL
jgi:hypothetical protein